MLQRRLTLIIRRQLSSRPVVESNHNFPKPYKLEEGKKYKWCTCGHSEIQPMCDGSHRKSGYVPVRFTAEKTETALLCCCKNTSNPPYCDMTHFKILRGNLLKTFSSPQIATPTDKPLVAARLPSFQKLEERKTYMWCACGASKTQPFCDNSHACSSMKPLAFTPEKTKPRWLCQCKQTKDAPYCDGTHLDVEIQTAVEGQPL